MRLYYKIMVKRAKLAYKCGQEVVICCRNGYKVVAETFRAFKKIFNAERKAKNLWFVHICDH